MRFPATCHNRKIGETLAATDIKSGASALHESLYLCYERLVAGGFLDPRELDLVKAWIADLNPAA